ncbi:GNAT family N-acetyltransferase [Wukongibacter sp. M2B1]|uniref:GNAT family N-acetyltransferase n=1 Tax=Wukongibacter sp. M2B1 TaxID=3088895 RepID=UPI003D79E8DB
MFQVRRAKICEAKILTDLVVRSEAYWGYDSAFMENFRSLYRVTEEFINNNETFVMEEKEGIIGFYAILIDEKETSLEYFYIDSKSIGRGYGKLLWEDMIKNCKEQGIDAITFVTSPQAKEFYIKMGAIQVGEVDSIVITDRKIPRLVYIIEKQNIKSLA